MDSSMGLLPVSCVYLFLGSKVSEMGKAEKCPHPREMGKAEKCPHPREPLSGTPKAEYGGWEIIAQ